MSGQFSRMPEDQDGEDAEFAALSGGARRANGCKGCGQGPDHLARRDAIAIATFLERRFALLLNNPEHSLRYRGPGRGSWSAMEPAVRVSDVLGAADMRLRDLFDEETLDPVHPPTESRRFVASRQAASAVFTALAENVRRLTATIAAATTADWRRREPYDGPTAGELVWLALHDATHHLEDAELLLDATLTPGETRRPPADLHSVGPPEEYGP
jgi:hypothetical protein